MNIAERRRSREDALAYVRNTLAGGFWQRPAVRITLGVFLDGISYLGFDPIEVIMEFRRLIRDRPGERDLAMLIALYFERGANLDKVVDDVTHISDAGRGMCRSLREHYQVKSSGKLLRRQKITLPRLALAFPIQSCEYARMRTNTPARDLVGHPSVQIQSFSALIPSVESNLLGADQRTALIEAHA